MFQGLFYFPSPKTYVPRRSLPPLATFAPLASDALLRAPLLRGQKSPPPPQTAARLRSEERAGWPGTRGARPLPRTGANRRAACQAALCSLVAAPPSRRLRPTSRANLAPALVRDAVGGRSQALEGCRGTPPERCARARGRRPPLAGASSFCRLTRGHAPVHPG